VEGKQQGRIMDLANACDASASALGHKNEFTKNNDRAIPSMLFIASPDN
jgi:hypothetical protein